MEISAWISQFVNDITIFLVTEAYKYFSSFLSFALHLQYIARLLIVLLHPDIHWYYSDLLPRLILWPQNQYLIFFQNNSSGHIVSTWPKSITLFCLPLVHFTYTCNLTQLIAINWITPSFLPKLSSSLFPVSAYQNIIWFIMPSLTGTSLCPKLGAVFPSVFILRLSSLEFNILCSYPMNSCELLAYPVWFFVFPKDLAISILLLYSVCCLDQMCFQSLTFFFKQ